MLIILVAVILLGQLPEDCPPLYRRSPGKFCPDDHYAPCQGTSIRRIGQAPPTTGDHQAVPYIGALFNIGFPRVESGEGSPGVVHELAPAGEWTEDFLRASWLALPFKGYLGVLIVLLISDVWSSWLVLLLLLCCIVASVLEQAAPGSHALHPNIPPPFHSSESNRAFNRRHKPSHTTQGHCRI